MNKLLTLIACILWTGLLAAPVIAAQNDPAATPNDESQPQNNQGLVQPDQQQVVTDQSNPNNDPTLSLDERYRQRIEAKKRAAAMREQLLKGSQEQTPEQVPQ